MSKRLLRRLLTVATVATMIGLVAGSPAMAAAPPNDDFANAEAYTDAFNDAQSLEDATTETNEPDRDPACFGFNADPVYSVWYSLTLDTTNVVAATAFGLTGGSANLDIFTGATLSSLTNVNCAGDGFTAGFIATASTTYWLRVSADTVEVIEIDVSLPFSGADVSASVSDSADPVAVGSDGFSYSVAVANAGPSGATGVSVSVPITGTASSGTAILSTSTTQGSCSVSSLTVTCSLGSIASSGTATVTINVSPGSTTGTLTATATVSANETDPNSGNNTDAESTTTNNSLGCTIFGTNGNDTGGSKITGTSSADVICGLAGDDDISGGNGNDTIYAGPGNDSPLNGGNGDDTIYGGTGNDSSYGEGLLQILDNGSDTIYGGPGNDSLDGQYGNDTLYDHDGTDTLVGNIGNDAIDTQDGVGGDTADGGLGTDTCTVDAGDNTSGC